jgi:hypothetical protein
MGPKRAPVGGFWRRQRPLTLRSRVVTTKMQLDINVDRLLLNRGCLTAPHRNSDLTTHVRRLKVSEFQPLRSA